MSKRRKDAKLGKTKSVGYGYVARWKIDGVLGWWLPPHLTEYGTTITKNHFTERETQVLCRITVEQVFDRKGRPITRKVKGADNV